MPNVKDEGGYAFPVNYVKADGINKGRQVAAGGMTVRQFYAGMALSGILANLKISPGSPFSDEDRKKLVSSDAHAHADAMLRFEAAEREAAGKK